MEWTAFKLASDPLVVAFTKLHPSYEQFTLFGPQSQRHVLAWTLLVANTLLGLKIVSDVLKREDWRETFRTASFYAVRNFQPPQLAEYLRIIKSASSDEWFDVVLSPLIEVFVLISISLVLEFRAAPDSFPAQALLTDNRHSNIKEKKDIPEAEKLAGRLTTSEAKIDAFIFLGKLKAAYLLAVKTSDVNMVRRILDEANAINDTSTMKLCGKYLDLATQAAPTTPK